MKNIFTYLINRDFNKYVLNDKVLAEKFLLEPAANTCIPKTDILVLGPKGKESHDIDAWCTTLSQEYKLVVTNIICTYKCNEEFLYHLYFNLPKNNIKAVIIHCFSYKKFLGTVNRENLSIVGVNFFSKNHNLFFKKIEAFFYFLQIYLTIILMCNYFNAKVIIVDTYHTGIIWTLLRWVFFIRNKNATIFTKINFKKIIKFILK